MFGSMKKITLLGAVWAGALVAIGVLAGCSPQGIPGNGHITFQPRYITDFTRLEVEGAFTVHWTNSIAACSVAADDNLLEHILTVQDGDTLRIYTDESIQPSDGIKIELNSSGLQSVSLAGACSVTAASVTGLAGEVRVTGASVFNASGTVSNLNVRLTGASTLYAADLKAKTVDITMIGSSSATVVAGELLKASLSGACSLLYAGNPATIEQSVSGASTIHHIK